MQKDKPKFDWVFVDEVQDINPKEFDVILSIAKENIFAVGDPYQSIYGFQGALGFRVFDYLKKFGCKEFLLRNNYRSVPEVVNKLNKIYDRKLVSTGVKDNKTNALLFRKNDDLFYVSGVLKTKRVPHIVNLSKSFGEYSEYSVNGDSKLKLMTIHSSKGKEFDNVGIYDFFPFLNGSSPEEERVYYVGCSRASKSYTPLTTMSEVLNFAKANV
jgi:DNA helicase-2/ATP-dependent DNA helicase PcrA